jgi:hypothetical protein
MHKTPTALAGTSPKSDDSKFESFCKRFIVGFGGGRVEAMRGRMSEAGRQEGVGFRRADIVPEHSEWDTVRAATVGRGVQGRTVILEGANHEKYLSMVP